MSNNYRYEMLSQPFNHRLDPTNGHPIEMGDMVCWDPTNRYIKRLVAASAMGPYFVGVAEGVGPVMTSLVDNTAFSVPSIRVRETGIFTMKTTAGDILNHGDPLVCGADPQTVLLQTIQANTEIVAYVFNPMGTAAITGATGVEVEIRIASNFPAVGIN